MKSKLLAAASLASLLTLGAAAPSANAAYGYCHEPRAPSLYIAKPNKPYCAADRSCDQWQVSMYRNEVRSYFDQLQQYADDVDEFYRDAADYVQCMSDLD